MSIESDLADIQRRISEAQRQEAQATYARDSAQKTLSEALEVLKTEYGVNSTAEAVELLKRLTYELETGIEQVRRDLEE